LGFDDKQIKKLLTVIDKREKVTNPEFKKLLNGLKLTTEEVELIKKLIDEKVRPQTNKYFEELFSILKTYGLDKYCEIRTDVVRGLDYYTGLVFEVKDEGGNRSYASWRRPIRQSCFGF